MEVEEFHRQTCRKGTSVDLSTGVPDALFFDALLAIFFLSSSLLHQKATEYATTVTKLPYSVELLVSL